MVTVKNLWEPSYKAIYSCSPKEAVIAAHAQSLGDFNTWDYQKYGHLVKEGEFTIGCGEFCALTKEVP